MSGRLCLALVLVVQAALLGYGVLACSCVYNEEGQVASGLIHGRSGNFSTFTVNPPLSRFVAALPLSCLDIKTSEPYTAGRLLLPRWEYTVGRRFLEENAGDWMLYVRIARVPCMVFALAGSVFCYCWAAECYGGFAGMVATVLWAACPYVLAHGCLVGPDVPAATMGLAAAYCFWQWLRNPQWLTAMVAGLVLGLAELCKFTLLVFYPLLPLLWVLFRLPERKMMSRHDWLWHGGMLAAALLVSIYVINCGYLAEDTFTPLEEFRFRTTMLTGFDSLKDIPPEGANRFASTWLGKLPVPLPANYVQGIDTQRYDFERGLPSYLRGQWADHGWWYYYLYALAVKVPLGTWCLIVLAVGVTIVWRTKTVPWTSREHWDTPQHIGQSASWRDEMVVLAPGLMILIFVSSQTGFSVHSRYVIPALPFLFVWTSKVARVFETRPFTKKRLATAAMLTLALTWSVGSSLAVYPHNLSYFNELAIMLPTPADATYPAAIDRNDESHSVLSTIISAGPSNGPRHLLDSNIDWGQDLLYLKNWLNRHPDIKLAGLACYGSYPATFAGIPQSPQPPLAMDHLGPEPGWYALSVNCIYSRDRQYRYFLHFQPVAMAGYSIYIYHVTPEEANRFRRE